MFLQFLKRIRLLGPPFVIHGNLMAFVLQAARSTLPEDFTSSPRHAAHARIKTKFHRENSVLWSWNISDLNRRNLRQSKIRQLRYTFLIVYFDSFVNGSSQLFGLVDINGLVMLDREVVN
jgi:hypothetical protein